MSYSAAYDPEEGIAIIGMAGRFPGARNVAQLWQNLLEARETISHFRDDELEAGPVEDMAARASPAYVRAQGILDDIEMFDAGFFGINLKEAEVLDPQHRVFLETAWEALEDAGYDPQRFTGPIGVFAGAGENTYYLQHLLSRRDVTDIVGLLTMMTSKQNDYLTTRVAYKLDLKGPALNIQTACSTALVAVCSAVQSLLSYQCDMALAGGVSIALPQRRGYLWQEGMITSPDGHCRAFDRDAQGTVFSNGVGIVVLRRLRDALTDGDTIYAVIKGAALNNDGAAKVSFSAPSVDGQAQVISMAHALGGIDPETISYIEAHGTGTSLGDPVEIAALTQAFRAGGAREKGFCAVGSIKTNIGHVDHAAGVAGLIKTTLALHHKLLPASLHFKSPNPKLGLEDSPFYVNAQLQHWKSGATPRRAGVSAFGVGGTNAHVVLEEAPVAEPGGPARNRQLLVLSARSAAALDRAAARLKEHLAGVESIDLADAAYTLQTGRRAFNHRRALVCSDRSEAIKLLAQPDPKRVFTGNADQPLAGIAFLFPGQGAQYVNMGRTLYQSEASFRTDVDECCEVLRPHLGLDLRTILYPSAAGVAAAQEKITQTAITQPALFVIEYALARLWMSWGIEPAAMIGHSLGEYVAACLAGVFTRDDALRLISRRGRMMQDLPSGAMLAVRSPLDEISADLRPQTAVAALNAPSLTVISGDHASIAELEGRLTARQVAHKKLPTSHAFHSPMMEPIVASFTEFVRTIPRTAPVRRWISGLTGVQITDAEAIDPAYWAQQMLKPVRFMDGVGKLMDPNLVLLEVGPGQALTNLTRQHPDRKAEQLMLTSLHPGQDFEADLDYLLAAAGRMWTAGAGIDWSAFHAQSKRRRISLPTYPFERRRFWITPAAAAVESRPLPAPIALPESTPLETPVPESTSARPSADRGAQMIKRVQALFSELSGMDAASLDPSAMFLELGLDSLFLTQAIGAIQKRFGFTVSLLELLGECSTLEALAARMVSAMPADPARERIAPASATPPAAKAGSALAYPMIEAFFFGPSNRQLFANYHLPVGGHGRVLTVICPPLFSDYTRTQLALRKLAISLAESGQHVLRLDYRGTGDSFGDLGEVAISDWVEDIAFAVQEGREMSGSSIVRLLGVRAGALVACRSVGATNDVQRLVLWDPVSDGAGYLESLRRVQMAVLERNYYLSRAERREAMHEYAGYRLSERMTEEFCLLDANTYSSVPKSKLHIVSTTSVNGFPVQGVPQDVARFACNWETESEDVLIPRLVLERLIACLTMS